MTLVEQHTIKPNKPLYSELATACYLSKNLYNQALYRIRQYFFKTGSYFNKYKLINEMTSEQQVDYVNLPRKVSQQVIGMVDQNFKSFFTSLKSKNVEHKVSIPRYLDKHGSYILIYTNQAVSKPLLKQSILKLSGIENTIKIIHTDVQQVRVIPKNNKFIVEVIYRKEPKKQVKGNKCVGIDLGLNNLATVGTNYGNPFIINGKPLKSINQYYNKNLSKLQKRRDKCRNKSVNKYKIQVLTNKRNNKVNDYLHKASRLLVNQLVSNRVATVVIGHNKEWKQDINIGKSNNQKFVQIPHSVFINMLKYKCELEGITVIIREESYTSKCSFFDNEEICKHTEYKGKRIKRGLFRTSSGRFVNADLNGALNILRKEIPNAFNKCYGIEVCSTPRVLSL